MNTGEMGVGVDGDFRGWETPRRLEDRTVLVTGAAGGLGGAITRGLVAGGSRVWAADRRAHELDGMFASLPGGPGVVRPLLLDVRDPEAAADAVKQVCDEGGRLDVLINNAAVDVTLPVGALSAHDADLVIGTDLLGPIYLCLEAFRRMTAQGGGHIVNILSTAAVSTWTEAGLYSAAKHGLRAFTHTLFREAKRDCPGVGITGVIAGGMRTPFITERFPDADISLLQEPSAVADAVFFALTRPVHHLIPEIVAIPHNEPSWP